MENIKFENGVNDCLKNFEAPLKSGPIPRWQRKEQQRLRSSSGPLSPLPNNFQRHSESLPKKTISKTPKKGTPKRKQDPSPSRGDRFIPNRPSNADCDWSHHQMMQANQGETAIEGSSEEEDEDKGESATQKRMSNALADGKAESKILHFKSGAPAAKEGYQNDLHVLYCQSKPSGPKARSSRHIPQAPDRILDAPELLDDYYLNLLDWGNNNLLSLALAGAVYIWNAESSDIKHLFQMDEGEYVSSVAWVQEHSMTQYLAVGTHDGNVQLWDVEASKCVRCMGGHAARVGSLSWNCFLLSSGSRSGAIHHHDVRVANHKIGTLLNHSQEVCGLKWSPDGKLLASGGNDNVVNIWPYPSTVGSSAGEPSPVEPLFSLTHHQAAVKAISWCPWQPNVLATGGGTADRHIRFWNGSTGATLNSVDTKSQVCSILWSNEYKEIISGHGFSQHQLTIWKYPSMARVADLTGHTSRVLCMAMSPDGQYVASAAADETLRLWKCFATQPKQKKTHRGGEEPVNRLLSCMRVR
ncbi:cell division cycle protein 20 homolog [Nematostella vectensis]|uniref:cell division cycle protein 20 homolog n=1 Tax=Nematostella vectensis TaxID=45351 RepID=UPI002076EBE5|nr:cell division cycle protein 20 homolog [Nematostella vectensis]